MNIYRLKKDLPGHKSGELFELFSDDFYVQGENDFNFMQMHKDDSDWFELVKDNSSWMPEIGEECFSFDNGRLGYSFVWDGSEVNMCILARGEVFRSREELDAYLEYLVTQCELRALADDYQGWSSENDFLNSDYLRHYYIKYNPITDEVGYSYEHIMRRGFYFKSVNSVKLAILRIGKNRLRKYFTYGKEIAT